MRLKGHFPQRITVRPENEFIEIPILQELSVYKLSLRDNCAMGKQTLDHMIVLKVSVAREILHCDLNCELISRTLKLVVMDLRSLSSNLNRVIGVRWHNVCSMQNCRLARESLPHLLNTIAALKLPVQY